MGWNQPGCLLQLHETAMCVPFGCFLDFEQDGTLYHLLKQWSPVSTGYETGNGMADTPDPDISESDMRFFLREPIIPLPPARRAPLLP